MHALHADVKAFTMGKSALSVGALLSSAVGLLFYVTTANTIEHNAQARFDSMARGVQTTINGRVKSYNDVLRGTASLFQTSDDVTREQFQRFVHGLSLEREFPGIEAINFIRYLTEAERPAFEEKMRADVAARPLGYPPFRIIPPGQRPDYHVITFIEPIKDWTKRFGVDVISAGGSRANAESRDTGHLAAAGIPLPFVSGPNHTVLSMRLPLYRNGMPATNVEERRAAYFGSVGIGFTVQTLIQGVLDEMQVRGVRLILVDSGKHETYTEPMRVLFDSKATVAVLAPAPDIPSRTTFVATLPIGYNLRVWEARFSISKSDLYTGFDAFVPWMAMLAGFVSTMLLYSLFQTLSSSRRHAVALAQGMTRELRASEAKLQMSNEKLRRLAAHAENIKEEERKRIAREIHDDLGQNLLALRIEADMLSARTEERHPRLHARARSTVDQIDTTIKSVRQIINDLRPNVLDLGLNAAVDWQIAQFRHRTGIPCDLMESHQDIPVSDHCATALFRILQESLSNISRHAQATQVQVILRVERDWIWMSVGDNGVGLHPKSRHQPGSFGLVGIEERINILGGTFEIHSAPGEGTTIRIAVPMRDAFQVAAPRSEALDAMDRRAALV